MKPILVSVFGLLVLIVQTAYGNDVPAALSTTQASAQKEILDTINDCRRNVDPPATDMLQVEWNEAARETAQKYADTCSMKHSSTEARRSNGMDCGENLFMSPYAASWKEAIDKFCSEKINFTYGKGPNKPGDVTGHFTQAVWYKSYMIGCAVAYCPDGNPYKYFYVCHQCPAGNIEGKITTPYEKGTTCGKCPSNCNNKLCTNPCRRPEDKFSNCADMKDYCNNDAVITENCKSSCNCNINEIV